MGQQVSEQWRNLNLNCTSCCGVIEDEARREIVQEDPALMRVFSGRGTIHKNSAGDIMVGHTLDTGRLTSRRYRMGVQIAT